MISSFNGGLRQGQAPAIAGFGFPPQSDASPLRKEIIALPARFPDAGQALPDGEAGPDRESGDADCACTNVVEILEFRSLDRQAAGRYAAVAPAPAPAAIFDTASQLAEEIAALESRLDLQEQNARQQVERARAEGRSEVQKSVEQEAERRVAEARQQVAVMVDCFRAEHEQYFRRVEREVVRLALAIAARVLHREANMDPLLLAGAVRVALEKLADTSGLVLRTAPGEVVAWQEMFRLTGEARIHPDVVGDLALRPGDCILETRLGTVELGVRAQLEEIEKGFFDLLNQKPKRAGGGK